MAVNGYVSKSSPATSIILIAGRSWAYPVAAIRSADASGEKALGYIS